MERRSRSDCHRLANSAQVSSCVHHAVGMSAEPCASCPGWWCWCVRRHPLPSATVGLTMPVARACALHRFVGNAVVAAQSGACAHASAWQLLCVHLDLTLCCDVLERGQVLGDEDHVEDEQLAQHADGCGKQHNQQEEPDLPAHVRKARPVHAQGPELVQCLLCEADRDEPNAPRQLQRQQRDRRRHEQEEAAVVGVTDAVVKPLAVMVKAFNAAVACTAVFGR
eukprot:363221-Chlamydomonas_euryale.AAC.23